MNELIKKVILEITTFWKNGAISFFWKNGAVLFWEIGAVLKMFKTANFWAIGQPTRGDGANVMGLPNHWALGPNLIQPGKASRNLIG